jgi:hypothetical protein
MARAIGVDFVTLGIPELKEKFRALPLVAQRKVVRQASRDVTKVWRDSAIAATRVLTNPGNRSRRMLDVARSFQVRAIKRSRRFVGTRLITGKRERLGIKGDSRWYYPAHVHLGRKDKPARRGVAAKPYLREPLLMHGPQWRQFFGTLIRDGIERAAAQKRLPVPAEGLD